VVWNEVFLNFTAFERSLFKTFLSCRQASKNKPSCECRRANKHYINKNGSWRCERFLCNSPHTPLIRFFVLHKQFSSFLTENSCEEKCLGKRMSRTRTGFAGLWTFGSVRSDWMDVKIELTV
jgi:hypothetical protein